MGRIPRIEIGPTLPFILPILFIPSKLFSGETVEREDLTGTIIGCAMKVHSALGAGFLESVYRNALAHELRKAGLDAVAERPIAVRYDGVLVGDFKADLLVEGIVIVEIKAVQAFAAAHEVQLVNYLTATGLETGLLFNFGTPKLEFKRKHRTYKKSVRQGEQDRQDEIRVAVLGPQTVETG